MNSTLSARSGGIAAVAVLASCLATRLFDGEHGAGAALRLVTATLAVAVVPGVLAVLLWRPKSQLTVLETIGFGVAVSLGLVQLLTMLAVVAHVSAIVPLAILGVGSLVGIGFLLRRRAGAIALDVDECLVLAGVCAVGVALYALGSPVDWFEDRVHVSIVRRLAALQTPRLDNLYFTPGIVYTYPFPGTHYFMALVARLSDLDALFVYHKLRFFWGPVALVMLHLLARAVFGRAAVATSVTITAVLLVANGTFAMVPGFPSGWGQLAPYSHASDVAMTVLLPALLVMAFGYLVAATSRERAFFLVATALLTLMLTVVHIREVVQVSVYLGCFVVVALASRALRPHAKSTAVLLGLVIGIVGLYTAWQAGSATLVADIVGGERARLQEIAGSSSFRDLLLLPASDVLREFVVNTRSTFEGLTPLFLFAAPVVTVLFWRQPLVWLVASATVGYLLVMSVPLLAIPYIYFSYFEILFTPVRNVITFVYLFAGVTVYVLVVALTRADRTHASQLAAGAAGGLLGLLVNVGGNQSHAGFFVPLMGACTMAMLLAGARPIARRASARAIAMGLFLMLGLATLYPEREPVVRPAMVSVRWSTGLPDAQRAALEEQFSLKGGEPNSNRSGEVNVWNYALRDVSPGNVRALVRHPEVVDTSSIDRSRFTVIVQPPESDHPYTGVRFLPWLQYPGSALFFGTALAMWVLGFLTPALLASPRRRAAIDALDLALQEPFHRRALPYALFMIPLTLLTARPTLSPLPTEGRPAAANSPGALLARMSCVTTEPRRAPFSDEILGGEGVRLPEQTACPPSAAVRAWARDALSPDAVFAINRWNAFLPSVFLPQQVVVFPAVEESFRREHELFSAYYRFYDERMATHRVQPFFNSVETPEERDAFIGALGVTHVLVDPAYYAEMRPALDALPGRFTLRYSDGQWAVYEVRREAISPVPEV